MVVLVIQGALAAAALIVKELPLDALRRLVAGVVVVAALLMLAAAKETPAKAEN